LIDPVAGIPSPYQVKIPDNEKGSLICAFRGRRTDGVGKPPFSEPTGHITGDLSLLMGKVHLSQKKKNSVPSSIRRKAGFYPLALPTTIPFSMV